MPTLAGENINYVCPQRIVKNGDKDVELYFRVIVPEQDVVLMAQSGDNVLAQRRVIAVSPGEIESLTIKKELLKDIDSEITVNAIIQR